MKNFFDSIQSGEVEIIDLSHSIDENSPTWEGSACGFSHKNLTNYGKDLFKVQKFEMLAGIGTHLDAPSHLFENAATIDQIPLKKLIFPIAIIDIRNKVLENDSYQATLKDVKENEATHGNIEKNSLLIFNTGWAKHWKDKKKYRNQDNNNIMHFPSIAPEIAREYLDIISGIGLDTLSPDAPCMLDTPNIQKVTCAPDSPDSQCTSKLPKSKIADSSCAKEFPVHEILLKNDKLIIENINANIEKLPSRGAFGICLPTKIKDATEAMVRLIAFKSRE